MFKYERYLEHEYEKKKTTTEYEDFKGMFDNTDVKNCLAIYMLSSVLRPDHRVTSQTTNKSWKFKISDSVEAIMTCAASLDLVKEVYVARKLPYFDHKIPNAPMIGLIGSGIANFTEIYVLYEDIVYKHSSFLNALDNCFNLLQLLPFEYPSPCRKIWLFLQKYLYELNKTDERVLSDVSSFISDLESYQI
jgi:hypothetical protein